MNILFLTQILPYPPDSGPKVKTWHVLRYLSQRGHKIILASFVRPEEEPYVETVRGICSDVHIVPIRRSRLADVVFLLRSQFSKRPFLIERDDLPEMRSLVNRIVETESIDVIHADQLTMTQFALPIAHQPYGKPALVFDAHNAVWTIVDRSQESAHLLLKPILALEAQRIRHHESQIVTQFDHTLTVSEQDKLALLEAIPKGTQKDLLDQKITVIPIAVDTVELTPTHRKKGSSNILTLGTLHYPPNADGIRWFANEVFPIILQNMPEATLTIVGKNPPLDFIQMAEVNPNVIKVTGYVLDLIPYFEAASMLVVPVRAGGGIRVRILEAFARAMPVITTTVGLERIEAQPGVDVLVEDDADSFARAVIQLAKDEKLQFQLAQNGRYLAETRYDWQIILEELDSVYQNIQEKTTKN